MKENVHSEVNSNRHTGICTECQMLGEIKHYISSLVVSLVGTGTVSAAKIFLGSLQFKRKGKGEAILKYGKTVIIRYWLV